MNIILTMKAVLNYLYNHLIDLINVKKIVFEDGSEQITASKSGASLFDIKLLSQAIADKGWAFMCHTNRRDLPKTDVPTLYNDIKFKYDNADNEYVTSEITGQNMVCVTYDKYTQKYYYMLSSSGQQYYIYTSNYPDLSNSTIALTSSEQLNWFLVCGKNINIVLTSNRLFHIYNKNWEFIKTFDKNDIMSNYASLRCHRAINGGIILTFSREDNSNAECYVVKINDDLTANISYTENLFTTSRPLPNSISEVIDNKFYITVGRGFSITLVEIDINDLSDYSIKNQSDINVYPNLNKYNFSEVVYFEDYFYITAVNKIYKSQNLVNWTEVYTATGNNWRIIKNGNDYFIFGDGYILQTNNFANFSTLLTFTLIAGMGEQVSNYCSVVDGIIIISSNSSGNHFYLYSAPTIKVYTDNYTINGNTVSINYYKYNDFKICLADGGTNDTNLETVLNYLGYLNYWLLNLTNETVCVQRDKNTYSAIFVGDDFIDDLEDLPTNDYSSIVLKNQLSNIASALISIDTINNLQDGTKDTVYQTSAPTLIIAGRTSNSSDWYLEIQLSSDGVTFITVARYGVSNGDPASSAIIPIIVGSGVYWKVVTTLTSGYIKYGAI
ncbi:MAG: hypothetical protein IJ890_05565 [Clostridia bacterium]|nr:hypothetical protein [Clostridia bacterium]